MHTIFANAVQGDNKRLQECMHYRLPFALSQAPKSNILKKPKIKVGKKL